VAGSDLTVRLLSASFGAIGVGERVLRSTLGFAEGVALGALDEDARARLTRRLYERARPTSQRELFPWERRWFAEALPPAPASILVGGAGDGRETRCLAEAGYRVLGFDPVAPTGGPILRGGYEDLTAGDTELARRVREAGPWDAVLLGWGSYTHVVAAQARAGLLARLRTLSTGPVLVSYWRAPVPAGRAKRAGYRIGRWVGRGAATDLAADGVRPHCGYVHRFHREEIETLAARAGYRVSFGPPGVYGHATLRPVPA